VNSFISWVGGKMQMRELIVNRFPLSYAKYIEVFGGAGWVLFHKRKEPWEMYNDYDARLVNLFRCVRERPEELIAALDDYPLNARLEFHDLRRRLKDGNGPDIVQAADFFRVIRYSYGSKLRTYSAQPCDISAFYPVIRQAHHRLKTVVIENRDFESCIRQYDAPDTFFYLDPPYFGTEDFYDAGFTDADHSRLHDMLCGINGKFLLSYNACDFVRELYAGFRQEEISRVNSLGLVYNAGAVFEELLISNYGAVDKMLFLGVNRLRPHKNAQKHHKSDG